MPVIGFDDERVRDAWLEELEREGAVWVVWGRPAEGTWAAAREELSKRVLALAEALVEALAEIGEAVLEEVKRVWELIGGAGAAGRYRGPRHYNCRCLPVERVDPVRAGRTMWWTRK